MKGLLTKDFYLMLKNIKSGYKILTIFSVFFIMLAVSTVKGNFAGFLEFDIALYLCCFFPLMLAYVPTNIVDQDRISNFNEYEITFPISNGKKIMSKYIISTISILSSAIFIIIPILCCVLTDQQISKNAILYYLIALEVSLAIILVSLPILLCGFDSKKLSMIFYTIIMAVIFILDTLSVIDISDNSSIESKISYLNSILGLIVIFVFIALIVLFFLSYIIAMHFYKRKRGVKN